MAEKDARRWEMGDERVKVDGGGETMDGNVGVTE